MRTERCRYKGCKAEICFARTPEGKAMPIDAVPFPREDIARPGRWLVVEGPKGLLCHRGDEIDTAEQVYVSHFASCPGVVTKDQLERWQLTEPALAARVEANRG